MAKRIGYLRNASAGVNYHRLEIPMDYLSRDESYHVTETDISHMADSNYDVLIFNRIPYQPYSNIAKLKSQGVKIIFDIDDYWVRPAWHGMFNNQFESEFSSEIIKYLRLADVVWVSTPYLQRLIAEMQIKSYLVPNALDYSQPHYQRKEVIREELNCGWVGVGNHHMDFKMIDKAMFKHSLPVQMVLCGVHELSEYWRYIAQVISGGRYEKVKFVKDLDVYNYGILYNELDIVILPSFHDTYSICKSNLKLLESGAHKLPVITNGHVYKEVNNKIGMRVEADRDWARNIKKLSESRRMRTELGEALYEYTSTKYDLKKINEIRKQTIDE